MANDFSQYLINPTGAGGSASGGGMSSMFSNIGKNGLLDPTGLLGKSDFLGIGKMLDPGGLLFGGGFLGDLFGGGAKPVAPTWEIRDGKVYASNRGEGANPYPYHPDIPGLAPLPQRTGYVDAAEQVRILSDLLPSYSKAIAGQIIPLQQANLAASQATSGPMAQLMLDLYKHFGPQLNDVGNQIAQQNAMAQAERDKGVLAGPGKDLIRQALEVAKIYDPEYFSGRAVAGNKLEELLKSINLGSGLSGSEQRAIEQGLTREGSLRGTAGAPSNMETISNATRYGAAGRAREIQNQDQLSKAIAVSSQFLPASKSGTDVFQVATGKPSVPNAGAGLFTGVQQPGNEAFNFMAPFTDMAQRNSTQNLQTQQIASQKKDWLDQFVQFTSGLKNIVGTAGAAFGI